MGYPGGKNGAGVYQAIINQMPPHKVYIEPFLGGGAILRLKRPAELNIGIDLDPEVIQRFRNGLVETPETTMVDQRQNGRAQLISPYPANGAGNHRQIERAYPHAGSSGVGSQIAMADDAAARISVRGTGRSGQAILPEVGIRKTIMNCVNCGRPSSEHFGPDDDESFARCPTGRTFREDCAIRLFNRGIMNAPTSRAAIYGAIDSERRYQNSKWPECTGCERTIGEEILCAEECLLRARQAWHGGDSDPDDRREVMDHVRKVAAVMVRCMEGHGAPTREGF